MKKYVYGIGVLILLGIFLGKQGRADQTRPAFDRLTGWFRRVWEPLTTGK